MVLPEARAQLQESLMLLLDGYLTSDAFELLYQERWEKALDRAVVTIGGFGLGLCGQNPLWPYRLTGKYAPKPATRRVADRCLLFLGTHHEYEWPVPPKDGWGELLTGCAMAPGMLLSLLLLILAMVVLASKGVVLPVLYLALGSAAFLGVSLAPCFAFRRWQSRRWHRYQAAGDWDVWPFFRCSDFEQAAAIFPRNPPRPC